MLGLNLIKKKTFLLLLIACISCAKGRLDPMDRQTGLKQSEANDIIIKHPKEKSAEKAKRESLNSPIPKAGNLFISPPPKTSSTNKTISFSVTEQVPLKDVLIELGRVAKIDIDIDPTIAGGIVVNARNRPLEEVIDRIADLGNLRYSYKNNILHFERDTPFVKNYSLDYLSEGSPLWGEVQGTITAILSDSLNNLTSAVVINNSTDGTSITPPILSKNSVTINKSAGLMYVFATKKQHQEVEKYLNDVQKNASAQVLIEAKMVEVKLKDVYKTGINWNWAPGSSASKDAVNANNSYEANKALDLKVGLLGSLGLNASVSALEEFGTTRTLSSPRIHAINNQKASLNFSDKFVYFRIESNQAVNTGVTSVTTRTITSTKLEENIGVELSIIPSINLKTNEITLNIKPKITVKSGEVVDPASPIDNDGNPITDFKNIVPVIQTRELNTIAKIQSGNVIVIGGLMQDSSTNTDNGIPFLQRIPIIGNLFKSVSKDSTIIETVIFIKATIVDSASTAGKVDREIQRNFDTNKREFF